MFSFSALFAILKELLPFLKEALLEGQTFKVWIKTNWLAFTCLVSTFTLTLSIVYLSEGLLTSQRHHIQSQIVVDRLQVPLTTFADRFRVLHLENVRLSQENTNLKQQILQLETQHVQDEEWMSKCGVNLETGQCRVIRQPVNKPPVRKRSKPTPIVPVVKPPDVPVQKPGIFQKLRNMLRREEEEEP